MCHRIKAMLTVSDAVLFVFLVDLIRKKGRETQGKRKRAHQTVQLMINRQRRPLRREGWMSEIGPLRGKEPCLGEVREVGRRKGEGTVVGEGHRGRIH